MESLGSYILSVAAAAVILGILSAFLNPKSSAGAFVKLIGGLYLTIVVIQPVVNFDMDAITSFLEAFSVEADLSSSEGEELARRAMGDIIKSETEAYILDKAGLYPGEATVEVGLSMGDIQVPVSVTVRSDLPEYAREELQNIIQKDLDIPKENQTWIGLP